MVEENSISYIVKKTFLAVFYEFQGNYEGLSLLLKIVLAVNVCKNILISWAAQTHK